MTAHQLVRESLALPPTSRAWLVDQIVASLEIEIELRKEWRTQLDELEEELEWWEVDDLRGLDEAAMRDDAFGDIR